VAKAVYPDEMNIIIQWPNVIWFEVF